MPNIAQDLVTEVVLLPPPERGAVATTLEQALQRRCSQRSFLPDDLPLQTLSSLLWAAYGYNRPGSDGRTAPSAHNWQEIEVHAVLREGAYRYDARVNRLLLVKPADLRALTGTQDFPAVAPLNLLYVADYARMTGADGDEREFLAGVAAGGIAQNVSLACAARGLACVVRALIDRGKLGRALGLRSSQHVVLAQTVGRPAAAW